LKVLVAGGAGFLGSHLSESLLASGKTVVCLDNLSTGSLDNIQHLIENPKFEFINHDITVPISLQVDQIYNLACPASPSAYQADPIQTLRTSTIGVFNLLELAKETGCRILQASTSEVYGDPEVHPQTEDYWGNVNPVGIRACYDEGKRAAEAIFFEYWRKSQVDIKVARIFNTYGPRMHQADGRVVSNFVVQALGESDITIYGSGNQTRSFCYVDDLIAGLIKFMASPSGFVGPLNLGNPNEFTITHLANSVLDLTNSTSKIVYEKLPGDDPKKRKPNISLAQEKLNWSPTIELSEGLVQTINYFLKIPTLSKNE
jgi:UDP-glucuronate decarboxylase